MLGGIGGERIASDGCHIRVDGPVVMVFEVSDGGAVTWIFISAAIALVIAISSAPDAGFPNRSDAN
jgi:hypothetical protein